MYVEDLKPVGFLPGVSGRAVGWLAADQPYTRGLVDRPTFVKLAALLVNPWQPAVSAGRHTCPFCRFTGGPGSVQVDGMTIQLGTSLVYIPAEDHVFVAPSLVLHYIDAHGYAPPEPFLAAVRACPPMRSLPYLKRLRELGVERLK